MRARNPRSGIEDYEFKAISAGELSEVARNLRQAQPAWAAAGLDARCDALRAWSDEVSAAREAIVDALIEDTGRRTIARVEFGSIAGFVERWCTWAPELVQEESGADPRAPEITFESQHVPYPLVGVISPWNFPLTLSFIDAIPALLAGCAVAIKPSEVTPRFIEPVADTIARVPGLRDVLAIFPGDGETGQALIQESDAICFTGSVATGRKVGAACGERLIPAFLELGGKDPAIVTAGADIDRAITSLLRGGFAATGQICHSIERVYVEKPVYEEFVRRLGERAGEVPLSDESLDSGIVGPFIHEPQAAIVRDHIEDAKAKGAKVVCGGTVENRKGGLYCTPTVLSDVDHSMKIMTEETFGPVLPVMACENVAEAVRLANDTNYGLSGAVFAATAEEGVDIAHEVNAGGMSVNDAQLAAGSQVAEKHAFADSGLGGSRMGPAAFTRFLRKKAIYTNAGEPAEIGTSAEQPE